MKGSRTIQIDLMNESKQVGLLYHYTSESNLKNILKTNKLKSSEENYMGNEIYFISFTRNENFHKKNQKFNVKTEYRITIDGDKLSNKYKIKPFAYIPGWSYTDNWDYDWLEDEPENVVRDFFNATGDYDEMEERVWFKKPNQSIINIKDYILAIDRVEDSYISKSTMSEVVNVETPNNRMRLHISEIERNRILNLYFGEIRNP
jgi:hypothetical protein